MRTPSFRGMSSKTARTCAASQPVFMRYKRREIERSSFNARFSRRDMPISSGFFLGVMLPRKPLTTFFLECLTVVVVGAFSAAHWWPGESHDDRLAHAHDQRRGAR